MRLTNQVIRLRQKLLSRKKLLQDEYNNNSRCNVVYLNENERAERQQTMLLNIHNIYLIDDILLDMDIID